MPPSVSHCPECGRTLIKISWSSLRTHSECKQRSYLARTNKLAPLANKRNFLPGSVTDRVVREWLDNDPEHNLGVMPDMVDQYIDVERQEMIEKGEGVVQWRNREDRERVKTECIEAVSLIEQDLLKYVVPFEYQTDFKFKARLNLTHPQGQDGTVILNGRMDLIVRDDRSRWWVWDVKHTRDNSYWRKTVGQLGFYDLSVELMFGNPTVQTGLLQPLCAQRVKPYTPSQQSRTELLTRIHSMAIDVWGDVRTPLIGKASECTWCPVAHACSKFTPVKDSKGRNRISF